MATIEGVIFDWAGTTVDFGCMAPVQAFVDAFLAWDVAVTLDETRGPMGMAKRDHIETMLNMPRIQACFVTAHGRDFTQDDIDAIYAVFEEKLLASLSAYATPKPYVLDAIATLKDMGIRIGSTTGYYQQMMDIVTEGAKAQGYEPEVWYCSDHVGGYGRPYPYMLFKNMQDLGLKNVASVLKVGDTQSDIAEGIAAGVRTVGVIEGSSEMGLNEAEWNALNEDAKSELRSRTRERFLSYGADFVINDFRELPTLIQMLG